MEQKLERNLALWELFEVIVVLQEREECARFFRDLCTMTELEAMAERWAVARLVHQGLTYREIRTRTGASTATITRVAHWVRHGEGGYRSMLEKLQERQADTPVLESQAKETSQEANQDR